MKRFVLLVSTLLLILGAVPEPIFAEDDPPDDLPPAPSVVITEVKLGGGELTPEEPREFITIFNQSDENVDLGSGNWRLEYTKEGFLPANCDTPSWAAADLTPNGSATTLDSYGVLAPGTVLSVERSLTDSRDGALRVVQERQDGTVLVHDLVGWGEEAPCFDTAPTPRPSTAATPGESLQRYLDCEHALPVDTGNNGTDFFVASEPSHNKLGGTLLPNCESGEEPPTEEPPPTPLTCEGVIITEVLPNAAGPDSGNEFIELYNPTTDIIPLDGCGLVVNDSEIYWFEDGIELAPEVYHAFYDDQTGLTLPNAAGGTIYLLSPEKEELHEATYQPKLDDDAAWAWIGGDTWEATYSPTPSAANISQPFKPCPEGQYRHAETDRCRSEVSSASTTLTPCGEGRERNPETNRCRNVAGNTRTLVPCDPDQTRNPETNRCRKISSTSTLTPCGEGQERNPETNRCRKVAGANTSATPNVQDIQATQEGNTLRWWIVGAVVAGAVIFAIFEWRRDITNFIGKLKRKSSQ